MCRILVVEDDLAVLAVIERCLAGAGYDVETATNGREAMDRIHAQRPDVVLTDVYMPEKDGIELIMELVRLPEKPRLIAMSGGGMLNDATMLSVAGKLGAVRTLKKPFRLEELLATVASVAAA